MLKKEKKNMKDFEIQGNEELNESKEMKDKMLVSKRK
jgi:hypothetical protein